MTLEEAKVLFPVGKNMHWSIKDLEDMICEAERLEGGLHHTAARQMLEETKRLMSRLEEDKYDRIEESYKGD